MFNRHHRFLHLFICRSYDTDVSKAKVHFGPIIFFSSLMVALILLNHTSLSLSLLRAACKTIRSITRTTSRFFSFYVICYCYYLLFTVALIIRVAN